uniref:Leucine zipper transcription factor-like protein 1 n=1 Tax=Laticauda laticaudata TaxID=8630 RepID=A0A8C5WPN4_LATLA
MAMPPSNQAENQLLKFLNLTSLITGSENCLSGEFSSPPYTGRNSCWGAGTEISSGFWIHCFLTMDKWLQKLMELAELAKLTALIKEKKKQLLGNCFWTFLLIFCLQEIARLHEENEKLKTRLKTIELQATNALDEKSKLEKALQTIQIAQGDQKFNTTQDVTELENTMANLKCQFEKTLQDSTASQKSLEENLVSTKHDLLKVQDQLALAEKELEKKFQQTAAYRNMKEILSKKNDQIKELRKKLSKYEPDD